MSDAPAILDGADGDEKRRAPVVHNCCECGQGWQRDYPDSAWGRCQRLGMRTLAYGAGCAHNFTPRRRCA